MFFNLRTAAIALLVAFLVAHLANKASQTASQDIDIVPVAQESTSPSEGDNKKRQSPEATPLPAEEDDALASK